MARGPWLRSGDLDRRVTILEEATQRDEYGDPVKSFIPKETVWADVQPYKGEERFLRFENQVHSFIDTRFFMRFVHYLTTKHRILYNGIEYDIVEVREINRKEGMDVLARARTEKPTVLRNTV